MIGTAIAWYTGAGLLSLVPTGLGMITDFVMSGGLNGTTLADTGQPVNLQRILSSVYPGWNPLTGVGMAAGNTPAPVNSRVPEYQIDMRSRGGRHWATLRLTRNATAGTNLCEYLGPGVYQTNYYFNRTDYRAFGGAIQNFLELASPGGAYPRLYLIMPADIAERNKCAEEEHARDFIYAYDLTLGLIQGILERVNGREYGPYDRIGTARDAVRTAIRNAVPAGLYARLGLSMPAWKQEFERLCDQSHHRDQQNWHSWGLELAANSADVPINLNATPDPAAGRVYARFTVGQTQINRHPSSTVIHY